MRQAAGGSWLPVRERALAWATEFTGSAEREPQKLDRLVVLVLTIGHRRSDLNGIAIHRLEVDVSAVRAGYSPADRLTLVRSVKRGIGSRRRCLNPMARLALTECSRAGSHCSLSEGESSESEQQARGQ